MNYSSNGRWWTLAAWTAASVALASAALAASVTPATLTLVVLFGALMLLVQLRWQSAARRATDERERMLALLRETLETTADGFLLLDLDGRVVSFNQKLVEMSGLSAAYFTDGMLEDLVAWMLERVVDPYGFRLRLEELDGTPDVEARDEIRFRDGRIFERYTRPHLVRGAITGRVWSFRDLTAERRAQEELLRSNRIEAIGHLAAGIAHEINTPIQYVGDNLRFLDESYTEIGRAIEDLRELARDASTGPVTSERLRDFAAVLDSADLDYLLHEAPRASSQALDGVERVAEIVRAMKEFSHPGSGLKVPTDLNHTIRSTATVARNEWKYVAELETRLDESLPVVLCLPGELSQAILNLVINAAHAIADRQRIEGNEEPGRITISTALAGEEVEIRVHDTGTGIPSEIRQRIFDPFFTTKEVGRGTGQGLTLVHSIVVEKHGGTVTFDTEMGVGTTFNVRLPHLAELPRIEVAA